MYDRSKIMKNAWNLYRTSQKWICSLPFSECLRRAWADAKKTARVCATVNDAVIITPAGNVFCRYGIVADYTMGWNITGKTYAIRKELRSAGFRWDSETRCWFTTDRKIAERFVMAH